MLQRLQNIGFWELRRESTGLSQDHVSSMIFDTWSFWEWDFWICRRGTWRIWTTSHPCQSFWLETWNNTLFLPVKTSVVLVMGVTLKAWLYSSKVIYSGCVSTALGSWKFGILPIFVTSYQFSWVHHEVFSTDSESWVTDIQFYLLKVCLCEYVAI